MHGTERRGLDTVLQKMAGSGAILLGDRERGRRAPPETKRMPKRIEAIDYGGRRSTMVPFSERRASRSSQIISSFGGGIERGGEANAGAVAEKREGRCDE